MFERVLFELRSEECHTSRKASLVPRQPPVQLFSHVPRTDGRCESRTTPEPLRPRCRREGPGSLAASRPPLSRLFRIWWIVSAGRSITNSAPDLSPCSRPTCVGTFLHQSSTRAAGFHLAAVIPGRCQLKPCNGNSRPTAETCAALQFDAAARAALAERGEE